MFAYSYVDDPYTFIGGGPVCVDFLCCVLFCLLACVCVCVFLNLESRFLEFEGKDLKTGGAVGKSV